MDEDNNVVLTGLADHIIERCKGDPPVMVAFDPAINFGAGERLVNDNEQVLILAARRIVRSLGCCVRIVHHTGKANAREQTTDQYSARGGSALPDGARMIVVVQSYNPEKSKQELPPGFTIRKPEEEQVLFMSRTISYAPANLPMIWLKRIGYAFEYMVENRVSAEEKQRAYADQIENFLTAQLKLTPPRYHSRSSLETEELMTRNHLRKALSLLEVTGRVTDQKLPESMRSKRRQTYIHPTAVPVCTGGKNGEIRRD
jgi:RecA-family ATPase